MNEKSKIVTFKVTPRMKEAMGELIAMRLYRSRAELVREAVKKLIENEIRS